MRALTRAPSGPGVRLPWFRVHPGWTVVVAGGLFLAVFVVRLLDAEELDAVNLLYALPVALVALAFGRTAGIASGVLAVVLVGAWSLLRDVDLSALGWASRAIPLLLLGVLLGDASDRLEAADEKRRALENAAQRHRDATEVNDTLVQGMAAAKWSLEAGRTDAGLAMLSETLELGHKLVSELMREGDMGHGGHRPPDRAERGSTR